ncbi:MAG: B12-binding domain-containing radical SAM protein [Desulfuromonadaceae bacterium]|nr:B12-binding domain-containing radical SAM protein [Desulfuromonadaceae bacterium]
MSEQLDILLINVGAKKKVYQDLSKDYSACEPPFWAALTAGYLRSQGFKVEILDANGLNLTQAETAECVKQKAPRITAIVVYGQQANTCTPLMVAVETLCREIKQLLPEQQLIVTGWHPSALPERTLRETQADLLAQGEGFYTLAALLRGEPYADIPGLWWKEGDKILSPELPQRNVPDLSAELSTVAWDLIPWETVEYRAFNWMCLQDLHSRGHYASLYTSLGCPYKCSYCAIQATYGERKIRYWSTEWVMRQIDTLARDHGVKNINLIDELFVFNPAHYLPIAKELLTREYKINFCAFARVDAVDRISAEDLALLKKAGFNWFKLGIETGSVEILGAIEKGKYTKEDIRRVVKKIHQAGIDLCANFMFGLPGDDFTTMQDTFSFSQELNCAFPSFFCTMATPGSDLYREALEKNIPLPETWLGFAQQGYDFLPLPTEKLTAAQVLAFRDYAFDAYFTNPAYLHMIETRFGAEALEHIKGMTRIKLKRRILGD